MGFLDKLFGGQKGEAGPLTNAATANEADTTDTAGVGGEGADAGEVTAEETSGEAEADEA